jgi:chromosomal replication initiator protein
LAFASLKHKDISIELAQEALRDKLRITNGNGRPVQTSLTIAAIQEAVAREWGVTLEGLKSKTRTKLLTVPRQIAMFLTRDLLGTQLIEIGNAFGGRDHSTVIHSIDKTTTAISTDPILKARISNLKQALHQLRV